jgi:hypothetical protein
MPEALLGDAFAVLGRGRAEVMVAGKGPCAGASPGGNLLRWV